MIGNLVIKMFIKCLLEVYLGPGQTLIMGFFVKIVNDSIIDVEEDSKYAFGFEILWTMDSLLLTWLRYLVF